GSRADVDVPGVFLEVRFEVFDVADDEAIPARADLAGILVEDRGDMKAALAKAVILHQRAAHAPRTNQHDAVAALQAQDVADAARQLGYGVPEAAFAEGAEEREVFADLRRGRAPQTGQLS